MNSLAVAIPPSHPIVNTISWSLNINSERLLPYTHFVDDLHLDEIDMMLLIATLEHQHQTYLTPEQVGQIQTIADAMRYFS